MDNIEKFESREQYQKLADLFEFSASNGLEFEERIANKILEITNSRSKLTFVTKNGICKTCDKKLESLNLSTPEFVELQRAFLDKVIVGRDIFRKSTPDELDKFKRFVEAMPKFDVVVDGLNVTYSAGVKQSPYVHSMLVSIVFLIWFH